MSWKTLQSNLTAHSVGARLRSALMLTCALCGCSGTLQKERTRQPLAPPSEPEAGPTRIAPVAVERTLLPYNKEQTVQARNQLEALLQKLASQPAFALGHEDSTAYGVGWQEDGDRSDIKSLCSSHAAVLGWDIFGIEKDAKENGDGVNFELMRKRIKSAYEAGGINTISWHSDNPVTGGDAWDATPAVSELLPGQPHHQDFVAYLDRAANFLQSLRGPDNELIPIIFRPFHEHTGGWFWWGKAGTQQADYIKLWRFTVDFLRNTRELPQLLFAFSPGGGEVTTTKDYLYGYPGDSYVDILGLDYYYLTDSARLMQVTAIALAEARARGKVAAITEFGARGGLNQFGVESEHWFTHHLLSPFDARPDLLGIAYALAWRNAREDHCFVSYPGHKGAEDFRQFCADPRVLLQTDLGPL